MQSASDVEKRYSEDELIMYSPSVLHIKKVKTESIIRIKLHDMYMYWLMKIVFVTQYVPVLALTLMITIYTSIAVPSGVKDHEVFLFILSTAASVVSITHVHTANKKMFGRIERNVIAKELYVQLIKKCDCAIVSFEASRASQVETAQAISREFDYLSTTLIDIPVRFRDIVMHNPRVGVMMANMAIFDNVIFKKTSVNGSQV